MSAVGQSNPFSDASEYNTLAFIIARATDEMQTVSIVKVTAVDTAALTVDVQVLVNLVTGANISVPHGVISARPYFRAQGGTSGIILDPVVGDIGVMVFASRDSSAVIAAKGLANPGSQRRFSWSDGIYFGGVLNATPIQYLQFAGGGITLLSPTAINIQSPDNLVTGPLEVTGIATFDIDVHVLGDLYVVGIIFGSNAVFSGNVTAASFTGGGGGGGGTVTSVATGTGLTGGPITTSGTISLDSTSIADLALAATALQSISIATGTGLTGGPLTAAGTTVALSAATIASLLPGSPVQGDIVYYNGAAWVLLAPGTAGNVLQTNGASANPTWVTPGGGGGSDPFNVTPLTHPSGVQPFVATDNFEQANGTAIDTTGSRYTGATAWTWLNQGAATAIQQNGSLVMHPDTGTPRANLLQQPVSGGTWTIQCQVQASNNGTGDGGGLFVRDSVSGKLIVFETYFSSDLLIQALDNPSTFNSNIYFGGPALTIIGSDAYPLFLQISFDGTTLSWSYSLSGIPGTLHVLATQAATTFLGTAPTHWGVLAGAFGTSTCRIIFDQFEQIA